LYRRSLGSDGLFSKIADISHACPFFLWSAYRGDPAAGLFTLLFITVGNAGERNDVPFFIITAVIVFVGRQTPFAGANSPED